jgi:hypothetical protein
MQGLRKRSAASLRYPCVEEQSLLEGVQCGRGAVFGRGRVRETAMQVAICA